MPVRDALDLHWCAGCEGVRAFESPPCDEGHGADSCPELACTDCGHAVLLGHLTSSVPSPGVRVPEEELLFVRSADTEPDLDADLSASPSSRTARSSWSSRRTA